MSGLLSLQSLCFRLAFVATGPLVGRLADTVGVEQSFAFLCVGFAVLLPPAGWYFLHELRRTEVRF